MPIATRRDKHGFYFQYGTHGSKYYFNPLNRRSLKTAYTKALRQTKAIHAAKNI